ncbi:prolyl oligopeptidase family serine peptidase [Mycobacterium sp. 852002-51961_SCH5331710]|uniref:alpha/beta hydrolase-fold protein n=1 Tax=Mycobacterium sp. 852002-51961_SCH5331710 TaxID=1834105 RepID=UPI0008014159|nr:prolyl oligopeptidase family serine peptidase [Mycobacterium sp. 852002-51961_SCH5331710]OBB36523.1 peptidase [Mycobacterium sp. 852002-51961_SCH5331710]
MSLIDLALLPVRIGVRAAESVLKTVRPQDAAAPPDLKVINGMPEGVPAAALRPEPKLPAPDGWPFGEDFPRTCGTGRYADGAFFWTDFLYDDHGATGLLVDIPTGGLVPPRGTYFYPDGPSARNGADIFRVAIGLTDTHTWWRVDWNTLLDASIPIALFTFDTDRAAAPTNEWPAKAGVTSAGIDTALLISAKGARLMDLTTQSSTPVEHAVDMQSRSFLAKVPRNLVEPEGSWTVRLAAGLADDTGDAFADVPATRGARPGQPNVYNIAFRTHQQEKAHLNFWSDQAQAAALSDGDVTEFSLALAWDRLADRVTTDEPLVRGTSTRWYVSSIELGQGVTKTNVLSTDPQFLGRVQPYSVCLPSTYTPGRTLPLTLLLHSLALGQNQFAAIDPRLLHQVCEDRESVVVTPLARGPSCWYFDEGELDVWEVWARVAEQLGTDPNRTVVSGYSMGGYAAYKLGLTYPQVFAQAVALAGPPVCGVRLLPNVDVPGNLDPNSHCARAGDTWELLPNARWLPFVIAHGVLDQFVPITSVLSQVLELDRLGYRYRFTVYPFEDHVTWVLDDEFDDPIAHMGTGLRQPDPGHITYAWYPELVRPDLGLGPQHVWWISDLAADPGLTGRRGAVASVDARSYARPDPTRTIRRHRGVEPDLDLSPGLYTELLWRTGAAVEPIPFLTLKLTGVAGITVDVARAGLASLDTSTIDVSTDTVTRVELAALPPDIAVLLDGEPTGPVVHVPVGRHTIALTAATVPSKEVMAALLRR